MPVSTVTSTVYGTMPRLTDIGTEVVQGKFTTSGRTLSDIIFLAKVPNHVTIIGWDLQGISAETASTFKLGITGGGTESTFGTFTLAGNALVRFGGMLTGCPFTVSLSDTDAQAGATIYATVSAGSHTTSISFDFCFRYKARGAGSGGG